MPKTMCMLKIIIHTSAVDLFLNFQICLVNPVSNMLKTVCQLSSSSSPLWRVSIPIIPETNYVPREYSVAAVLLLLFMVLISLVPVLNLLYFFHISTFQSSGLDS